MTHARTLAEKIWDDHIVAAGDGGRPDLLYVDLHLVHEVSSAQAFEGLRQAGLPVRRPDLTIATEDHNVPTTGPGRPIDDPTSRIQIERLRRNCAEFGVRHMPLGDAGQGIVHVVGPEMGLTMPGLTIACGDSHTSTHGAFGALAIGIGTSEVEHVLATQTLSLARPRTMAVTVEGELAPGVTAKDIVLGIVARIGVTGAQGHILEYRGSAIRSLSMEGRMTVCNMSAETGARAGMIAPDEKTFAYVQGRAHAPVGADRDAAIAYWRTLRSDPGARFDTEIHIDAAELAPLVTWGTNPAQSIPIHDRIPDPADLADADARTAAYRALEYMDLIPGTRIRDIPIDVVFIGSCTNSRIEDLRAAAEVMRDRRKAEGVEVMIVPGSARVRRQAEAEGLGEVFERFGARWRHAGCSMCLGMNPDKIAGAQRCASTSNRNFEGRQGPGARTHLVSPAVAAASAVRGRFSAPDDLD